MMGQVVSSGHVGERGEEEGGGEVLTKFLRGKLLCSQSPHLTALVQLSGVGVQLYSCIAAGFAVGYKTSKK